MSTVNPYEAPQATLGQAGQNNVFDESSPYKASGRFGRAAYLVYSIGFSLLLMLFASIFAALGAAVGDIVAIVGTVVVYLAMFYFSFIFLIRRLHDLNWSGWLSLLSIIPLVNLAIYIPALFFRGTEGANDYGPPRRYVKSHGILAGVLLSIFILGIVAAIAIPAYQGYAQRAQESATMQQN